MTERRPDQNIDVEYSKGIEFERQTLKTELHTFLTAAALIDFKLKEETAPVIVTSVDRKGEVTKFKLSPLDGKLMTALAVDAYKKLGEVGERKAANGIVQAVRANRERLIGS